MTGTVKSFGQIRINRHHDTNEVVKSFTTKARTNLISASGPRLGFFPNTLNKREKERIRKVYGNTVSDQLNVNVQSLEEAETVLKSVKLAFDILTAKFSTYESIGMLVQNIRKRWSNQSDATTTPGPILFEEKGTVCKCRR